MKSLPFEGTMPHFRSKKASRSRSPAGFASAVPVSDLFCVLRELGVEVGGPLLGLLSASRSARRALVPASSRLLSGGVAPSV